MKIANPHAEDADMGTDGVKKMERIGWYYLHTNGALIYKPELDGMAADIRESDFARGLWPLDPGDREGAWRICVEGLAAGANKARIFDLAKKWHCDDADAQVYAGRIGVDLKMDDNMWFASCADGFKNLQESEAGFGATGLEAMAELAKALGYKPSKMWGHTFASLVKQVNDIAKEEAFEAAHADSQFGVGA